MGRKRTTEQKTEAPQVLDCSMFYGVRLDEEQANFANLIWDKNKDIVFVNSKAGTGKTFISVGVANLLVQYGFFKEIIYIMSPYGEKKQGWLPGSIEEKSAVYFDPLYQAMVKCDINPYTSLTNDLENKKNGTGYVTCITDTFLRGQNLNDAVIIIDEAQNYTIQQLKKVLTRVGRKTKVIVVGHTLQCDLDDKRHSGFDAYINHFASEPRAGICKLTRNYRGWISQHADELQE